MKMLKNGLQGGSFVQAMPRFAVRACLWRAFTIVLQTHAWGQTGVTATISGAITDQSWSALPGATVTVTDVDANRFRKGTTLENGSYVVTQLPPGKYTLTVDKTGFKSYEQKDIVLVIGQPAEVNLQMQLGQVSERVEVTSSAPVIQTADASAGMVVDKATIVNAPPERPVERYGVDRSGSWSSGSRGAGPNASLRT